MAEETKVREFLDMPGLETYDEAMKEYVDNVNKTLTAAVNVLEASKLDIQVQQNLTEENKTMGRANLGAASAMDVGNHIADKNNPHSVTKEQIGLDNVDNTSDANKPVSSAQASAIAESKKDCITVDGGGRFAMSDIFGEPPYIIEVTEEEEELSNITVKAGSDYSTYRLRNVAIVTEVPTVMNDGDIALVISHEG